MGRLTLNILLSFAQFEREVIGERVRDKIAASKKKGCGWVGSPHSARRSRIASWSSFPRRPRRCG
jgi:DNA invertase Pin-like site-specific DNA recombinase